MEEWFYSDANSLFHFMRVALMVSVCTAMYSNNYESCVYVFGVFVGGLSFPKPGIIVVVVSKKAKRETQKQGLCSSPPQRTPNASIPSCSKSEDIRSLKWPVCPIRTLLLASPSHRYQ